MENSPIKKEEKSEENISEDDKVEATDTVEDAAKAEKSPLNEDQEEVQFFMKFIFIQYPQILHVHNTLMHQIVFDSPRKIGR